jgi:hypothetical protein
VTVFPNIVMLGLDPSIHVLPTEIVDCLDEEGIPAKL